MTAMPIPFAAYGAVPGGETLFVQPAGRYGSAPPSLHFFRPADAAKGREFLNVVSRPFTQCPAEAVMLYRDALVLDGRYVVAASGVAVAESYYNVPRDAALAARQRAQLARIAVGDVASLPLAGAPVVALFTQDCNNFGHVLAEMLPRLLHLVAVGLRAVRLLLPPAAEPFVPMLRFAADAVGLAVELVPCPEGSILRVPALHWVSLVGEGWFKSPTVLRLLARLRDAAGPAGRVERLFLARPDGGRRPVANAAEAAALAEAHGYVVVEPSRLPFREQVALVAGAREVAGAFGAALALTGVMEAGGRVGMVGPGYPDYFFWDMACLAGLRFDWAFAGPLHPFRFDLLEAPITLGPDRLRRVLGPPPVRAAPPTMA
jgi:capsular polysaccharide biosynthesis protein